MEARRAPDDEDSVDSLVDASLKLGSAHCSLAGAKDAPDPKTSYLSHAFFVFVERASNESRFYSPYPGTRL